MKELGERMRSYFDYKALDLALLGDKILQKIKILESIHAPLKQLYYTGDLSLLQSCMIVAIIGSRAPNTYAKNFSAHLAGEISASGGCILSGGALGIDIIAHQNALHTIMISPASLDLIYPASNAHAIKRIAEKGLILSEYEKDYSPQRHSFLQRNRLIIALADVIIIPYADLNSGSSSSAYTALKLGKPLYTIPHRIGESNATNELLAQNKIQAIYHVKDFVQHTLGLKTQESDEILDFCASCPSFQEAYLRFGEKLLEYELEGKIRREGGFVRVGER